ncbi:MAG: hypothetical protein LBS44_05050 [Deltaproteobacteria bacterium]|jgi:hypothetical protein|nr:hypothetical protein [Deltaproteobacteria bacterium]
MRSTLDELIAELMELKTLVDSIGPVNDALAGLKDTLVQRYISIRRRFDYVAFAVALYSSFEKFVENLITEYVQLETRCVDYSQLLEKLQDKHLTGSAALLAQYKRLGEGRYIGMSKLGVVKNLFDCLNGNKPYTLNAAAVVAHNANLRTSEVDAVFGVVGIDKICDRICCADAMMAWYRTVKSLKAQPENGVPRTVIDERLKDIVDRRNQIAHRGSNPTELLGSVAMGDAVDFIKSLATSILGFVVGRYLQTHHVASTNCIELALRPGNSLYRKRTIVVVDKPAQRLFVGQPVFAIVKSTGARWGRIKSLRIDDSDIQEIEENSSAPNGIGVGLDFKYPNGADEKLIALQEDDDTVWSPLEKVTDT